MKRPVCIIKGCTNKVNKDLVGSWLLHCSECAAKYNLFGSHPAKRNKVQQTKTNKPTCECGGELEYEGDFGAPFHGQSWKCKQCSKAYWKCGGGFVAMSDVDPADLELDPSDVI